MAQPPRVGASDEDHPRTGGRFAVMRSYGAMLRECAAAWSAHRASSMGAALAFYTLFSMAPVLVITIAIAGYVFGVDAARGEVVAQIGGLVGDSGAQAIEGLLEGARDPAQGLLAGLIAGATLLIAATTLFAELKESLDVVWGVKRTQSGLAGLLHGRLLAFGLILTMGFLLLVSLIISAALVALQRYWGGWFVDYAWIAEGANSLISFAIVAALFACIYKWLPDPRIGWRDVAVGSLFTALLFTAGKFAIGFYLGHSAVASSFGAAGSMIVVLLWVYYSTLIFFFGAEFTRVYTQRRGSHS